MNTAELEQNVAVASQRISEIYTEMQKVLVGQDEMIKGLIMGILADGHIIIEGVPGLAKTLAVKTLASIIDVDFKRIQFTPDLLPADIVGTMVFRQGSGEFVPRKGPVFSNIILADEINRAPAKVQSALLEAMQEKQVTLGSETFQLPSPFFVLATQNPIEQDGTYQLPEAELDRFLMKLKVDYPSSKEELMILRRMGSKKNISTKHILSRADIEQLKNSANNIMIDDKVENYIVELVVATREKNKFEKDYPRYIEYGASTRATLALCICSKINAMMEKRTYVIPDDVKAVVYNVLRHRIILSYEAESEEKTPEDIIKMILRDVKVP